MKIFATRKIPEPGLDLLRKNHELEINPYNRVLNKEEIIDGLKGKDGLLCLLTDDIDKEVITSEPKLRMIANTTKVIATEAIVLKPICCPCLPKANILFFDIFSPPQF